MVALACTGCWRDKPSAAEPAAPASPPPVAAKPAAKPARSGMPAACLEYKAAIEELARCPQLPQATRDAILDSFTQTSAAWASASAEERASLETACAAAADAVRQSSAACH